MGQYYILLYESVEYKTEYCKTKYNSNKGSIQSLDSVYVLPTGCGNINESRQGTGRPGAGKPHLIHKARH